MQVRLLGPVDVLVDGEARPVPGLRRKAVLAVLALRDREVVSTGQLADIVWGDSAPQTTVNTLQSHVSYLRGILEDKAAILARSPGYVLDLGSDGTDVLVVERLLRLGTQSADPAEAVRYLKQALALWRGRPLADLTDLAWLEGEADRLALLRTRIAQALSEARLAAGEHTQLLPELARLAADNPLDEQIHGQLMLALYRSGRQADALAVYRRLRGTLDDELGIDPSQHLRDLETAILQQDPSLDVPAPRAGAAALATEGTAAAAMPVPAQLPPGVAAFSGRGAELARLDALLAGGIPAVAGAVPLAVLSGTAGVGKTTLAVHWAHRVASQFPDGQLYVNLRGFDPAGAAVDTGQALRGFLEAFGVPEVQIPADVAGQAGLCRSLLAGKRVLVVLDNAASAEQVRSLLPGAPGCLTIVTSRDRLAGLVVTEAATTLALDLLTTGEARDLLVRRLGAGRVASDPDAVDAIVATCARLPLALTIAAARAAVSPSFPLSAIAAELREACSALDPFGSGDDATDVRAVFSWSYRALSAEAARMFRLLGLHPGPDITVAAAASLAARPMDRARALLGELTSAHLLDEHVPGRYASHDLLRAYSTELVLATESQDERDVAVRRVIDHYLHAADQAEILLEPFLYPVTLGPPLPGVVTGNLVDIEDALSWFTVEQTTLLRSVQLAADNELSTPAWQLAWILSSFLLRRGLWDDQATVCRAALDVARRTGDKTGQAHSLRQLAAGAAKSGRISDAKPLYAEALLLSGETGDHAAQGVIHGSLSWIARREDRHSDSLGHSMLSLDMYKAAGHRAGEAMALKDVGYAHAQLGNHAQAIEFCQAALAAMQALGEPRWEGAVWDGLGDAHRHNGDYPQAIVCYERAIAMARDLADRFNEADSLGSLGDVYRDAGDLAAARRAWVAALSIFDEIDHPDRDLVRAKLRSHAQQAALAYHQPAPRTTVAAV